VAWGAWGALAAWAGAAAGCDAPRAAPPGLSDAADADADDTRHDAPDGDETPWWADHTAPKLATEAEFFALAASDVGIDAVKFVVTSFQDASARSVRYMDSRFYTLHDEWYWFRLLNGQPVPGDPQTEPVQGLSFSTIAEIYAWAKGQATLPLDLKWVSDGRLYSPRFYTISLSQRPRLLGGGAVMHLPAYDDGSFKRDALWVFELEFSDAVIHAELVVFFGLLLDSLPPQVGSQLKWVVRSPAQEALAQRMESERLRYSDRILRYDALSIPGEVQVYSEGLTAGRLRVSRAGEGLDLSTASDVLALGVIPDWLPPAAGLLTAAPQTPLAHINVLARNRGIPNAYRGGLLGDPALDQLARVRAPVIIEARAPDHLRLVPMTEDSYRAWLALGVKDPIAIPLADASALPYTLPLEGVPLSEVDRLRPAIGGKAAGLLAILNTPGLPYPDRPIAVTVRAYAEHMAQLAAPLNALLSDPDFRTSARARFLLLEGFAAFTARYPTPADVAWREAFFDAHPEGDPVGDVARANGFKALLRATPVPPTTLAAVEAALGQHFAHLSARQGLRFRSSSTAEDIEGFNGAGLYSSNTGFLQPQAQASSSDRAKDVAWALKATWASYWSFEAFEERRLEAIDHRSGRMAVLVHPRFDDPLELSNGVFLYTALPPDAADAGALELNVQAGDLSVTNPTGRDLPEVDMVYLPRDPTQAPRIERRQASSVSPAPILSDAALVEVARRAHEVTTRWLEADNAGLPPEQRGRTLTLDFEFREMHASWPAYADGSQSGRRIIYKQARSLEPGLRLIPDALKGLPFPRDVVARTRRGERLTCTGEHLTLITSEVYTDPLSAPDLGFTYSPFSAFVSVSITEDLPALGLNKGARLVAHHQQAALTHPGMDGPDAPWALTVTPSAALAASSGVRALALRPDKTYTLTAQSGAEAAGAYTCAVEVVYASPQDLLRRLLDAAP
jgi:hypothetical protein